MVDSVVTKQELIDAQKDAQSLEDVINGPADTRVKPRIGPEMWTLATINSLVQQGQIKISDLSEAIQIALAAGAGSAGWTANLVADGNQTQKEINLFGGKKYDMPVGGYPLGAVVRLDNGDIVKSTVANNIINPNVDMTEWVSTWKDEYRRKLSGTLSIYEVMTSVEYSTYDPNNYEVFDATAVVQRAIDKAYTESKEIFVPSMFAIRSESLVLPNYVSFVGQEFGRSNTRYKSGFASYVDKLFVANPVNDTFGTFKRVRFYSRNMVYYSKLGNGSICFYDMSIYNADIYRNFIFNFGIVINGIVASSSNIYNNYIMLVRDRVLSVKGLAGRDVAVTSSLIDSNIYRNYINAIGNAEVIGFDLGTGSHFSIDHNFMDFFYKGVVSSNTSGGSINDNIFDVCFRGVENLNSNTTQISGNKFLKNSKSHADSFVYLAGSVNEVEVRTADWEGIKIRFGQSITMQGNTGYSDCLINIFGYSLKKIKTSGNTNHNDAGELIRLTRSIGGSLTGDGAGFDLQELKFRTVTSLPVVVITAGGSSTSTYTGDIVKFNDQHLINDGAYWIGLDGLGILYKQDRSITVPALAPNALHKSANLGLSGVALGADIRVSPRVIIEGVQHWAVVTGAGTYVIYSKNNGDAATVSTSMSFNVTAKNF